MINPEGLYDRGYMVDFGDGELVVYRTPITYNRTITETFHTITYSDTLQSISRQYYGDSFAWFMIADVNDNIEDIFSLPIGEVIVIPKLKLITGNYARR